MSEAAKRSFDECAIRLGYDPRSRWVGGYVDYEWSRLRVVIEAYGLQLKGKRVLEFGCNFGGSAVVMAAMGGKVDAVDIDAGAIELARLNAAQYGVDVRFQRISPAGRLPFEAGAFDFILCNSVLEYVDLAVFPAVLAEIDRVLKPGGCLLILGTSNRLWPREIHSRRWLVNYLPKAIDRMIGRDFQRGLSPFGLRRALKGRYVDLDAADRGQAWLRARAAFHGSARASAAARAACIAALLMGVGPGWLAPNMSVLLRRRPEQTPEDTHRLIAERTARILPPAKAHSHSRPARLS